jgi:hypothetical protein
MRRTLVDAAFETNFIRACCGYLYLQSKEEKPMKKSIILALVVTFAVMSFGVPAVFAAKAKTAVGSATLQGTLEKQDTDYVIKDGKNTFVVVGENLAPLVGKKVVANGKMTKTDKGKIFQVENITEQIGKKK